MKGVATAGRDG